MRQTHRVIIPLVIKYRLRYVHAFSPSAQGASRAGAILAHGRLRSICPLLCVRAGLIARPHANEV